MGELVTRNGGSRARDPEELIAEADYLLAAADTKEHQARAEAARARFLMRQAERQTYDATSLFGISCISLMVAGGILMVGGAWTALLELCFIAWLLLQLRRRPG